MAAITTGQADFEFINGGTIVPVMLATPMAKDGITPIPTVRTFEEALVASDSDSPMSEWLEPVVQEDWSGGFGVDYSAAIGLDTWSSPGYVLPAGASTPITVNATQNSITPLVCFAEFGGDLWIGQRGSGAANSGRVMRMSGGTGTPSNSLNAGANLYLRDLLVAEDGTGIKYLWASISDVNGLNGEMWKWNDPLNLNAWTQYAVFGAYGRNDLRGTFWVDEDQIGAPRIVTASGVDGQISYTKPYGNPAVAADWVEGVRTSATGIVNLVAARRHVWMRDPANVYDLNEQGDSPALLSESTRFYGTGTAVEYLDDYVYFSHATGIGRVYVGDPAAAVQSTSGTCSPGYLTRTESIYATGYCTALLAYQGGILAAMYCPLAGVPVVFWGKPKRPGSFDPEKENALTWHGPFVVGTEAAVITRMYIQTVSSAPSQTRLVLASWHTDQLSTPKLAWISMPAVGGAIAGLAASSAHRFSTGAGSTLYQTQCRLETLPDTVGDKGSVKHIHEQEIGSRGLGDPSATTKLTAYTRADAVLVSASWGTGVDVPSGPTYTVTPATLSGNKIEQRIDFFSPSGGATPPKPAILDSLRTTFFRTAPDFTTRTLPITYGPGVLGIKNTDWKNQGRSVDWFTDALTAMCQTGRIQMRTRENKLYTVKLKQFFPREATVVETTNGRIMSAKLVVAILAGPL